LYAGQVIVMYTLAFTRYRLKADLRAQLLVHDNPANRDVERLDHADEASHDRDRQGEGQGHEEERGRLRIHEDSFRLIEALVHGHQVRHERILLHLLHHPFLAEGQLNAHAERLLPRVDHPREPQAVDLAQSDKADRVRDRGGVEDHAIERFALLEDVVDHPIEHGALFERGIRRRDLDERLRVERDVRPLQELLHAAADRVAVPLHHLGRLDLDGVDAFCALHLDDLSPGEALTEQARERMHWIQRGQEYPFALG